MLAQDEAEGVRCDEETSGRDRCSMRRTIIVDRASSPLLVDTSGSMRGSRMDLAIDAGRQVVDTLTEADYATVIGFSSTATVMGEAASSKRTGRAIIIEHRRLIWTKDAANHVTQSHYSRH